MLYTTSIYKAIKFASKTHGQYRHQTRKGKDIPYISHPLAVGIILSLARASEDVIVAGILHDTIEDSADEKKVTVGMIAERFGQNVSDLVWSVTEENRDLPWEERKKKALDHIKDYSQDSLLLKSADLISNISEIIDDYARYGDEIFSRFSAPKERVLWHYESAMRLVLEAWPENPLSADLKFLSENIQNIPR